MEGEEVTVQACKMLDHSTINIHRTENSSSWGVASSLLPALLFTKSWICRQAFKVIQLRLELEAKSASGQALHVVKKVLFYKYG